MPGSPILRPGSIYRYLKAQAALEIQAGIRAWQQEAEDKIKAALAFKDLIRSITRFFLNYLFYSIGISYLKDKQGNPGIRAYKF